MKYLNPVARNNYINSVLAYKDRMGLTNDKMAEVLGLTLKTYQRFISGKSILNEFDVIMRVYQLSGKMMYSMTGAEVPREVENSQVYSQLDEYNQSTVDILVHNLYEEQCKREEARNARGLH